MMNFQNEFEVQKLEEICIVDDSQMPRLITQKICETYFKGVSIRPFGGVDEAIIHLHKFVKKRRYIFLDLNMPNKDGWHFLENYIPGPLEKIFILSSSDREEDISRARYYNHVAKYLRKPITFDALHQLFESHAEVTTTSRAIGY